MNIISRILDTPIPEILVIGDDLYLEASMARKAGAVAGLVTTGTSSTADADKCAPELKPHLVVDSMLEFVAAFSDADAQFRK